MSVENNLFSRPATMKKPVAMYKYSRNFYYERQKNRSVRFERHLKINEYSNAVSKRLLKWPALNRDKNLIIIY